MQLLFRSEIHQFVVQFRDYMRMQYHIELPIVEEKNSFGVDYLAIYIDEKDPNYTIIKQEYQRFIENLFDPRYAQASWQSGDSKNAPQLPFNRTSPQQWLSTIKKNGKFTLLISLICALVYLLCLIGYRDETYELFHYPADFSENMQFWRYVSHSLVHLSLWHFLFNLSFWWLFGGAIERTFGSFKLISLFFAAAIISGIAQNIASGPAFFGLSGVVYAVLGFVFIINKGYTEKPFDLPQGFFNMIAVGIGVGFISPIFEIYMGNAAHIAGLLTGLFLGLLHLPKSAQGEKE